jgi:hypothetical protein
MKTKSVLCIFLMCMSSCYSFQTQDRIKIKGDGNLVSRQIPVGDYREIQVKGMSAAKISYTQSEADSKADVTVDENIFLMYEFTVKNACLIIQPKKEHEHDRFLPTQFEVTLGSRAMEKVQITGNHTFTMDTPLHGDALELSATGNGHILLNSDVSVGKLDMHITGNGTIRTPRLNAKTLSARITGSGQMNLGGRAETVSAQITGSGDVHAFELQADDLQGGITGSGSIEAHVNRLIQAHVTGSGSINYKGTPHIDFSVTGTGKIRKAE